MKSRFWLEAIVAPRTLETACQLTASVAVHSKDEDPLLILIDDHLPYPQAILIVFGQKINTSHTERLNGAIRGRQARLARRTRSGSHLEIMTQYSIWLLRDLYNWTSVHYSLLDETPAMALGLTGEVWTVRKYVLYPVHVSDFVRQDWAEQRSSVLESAVDVYKRNKNLPIS